MSAGWFLTFIWFPAFWFVTFFCSLTWFLLVPQLVSRVELRLTLCQATRKSVCYQLRSSLTYAITGLPQCLLGGAYPWLVLVCGSVLAMSFCTGPLFLSEGSTNQVPKWRPAESIETRRPPALFVYFLLLSSFYLSQRQVWCVVFPNSDNALRCLRHPSCHQTPQRGFLLIRPPPVPALTTQTEKGRVRNLSFLEQ